jgi:HD-like signal output (HDOD) protein
MNESRHRILFVDDELNVLHAMQRSLRPMQGEWAMNFVASGEEALTALERDPYDVIVSDIRMPGMDGAALLDEVARRHPGMVRLILSGHAERDAVMRTVSVTHQYLSKPCDATILRETVVRALARRELVTNECLKTLVAGIHTLPSASTVYADMMVELRRAKPSSIAVGQILATDAAMTAKLLQIANSAFFGFRTPVSNTVQAVQLLGLDTVRSLVLTVNIFNEFDVKGASRAMLGSIWRHSMSTGSYAKAIAARETDNLTTLADSFTAGLLHDVGRLMLAIHFRSDFSEVLRMAAAGHVPIWCAELIIFGTTHAEVGAYLLALWGLPDAVVNGVAWHHRPGESGLRTFEPLTAVHVADVLDHTLHPEPGVIHPPLDAPYLAGVGLGDRVSEWQEHCCAQQCSA